MAPSLVPGAPVRILDHRASPVPLLAQRERAQVAGAPRPVLRWAVWPALARASAHSRAPASVGCRSRAAHADERLVEPRAALRGLRVWLRARCAGGAGARNRCAMAARARARERHYRPSRSRDMDRRAAREAAATIQRRVSGILDALRRGR